MSTDFKGSHYPKVVILHAVFFYVRYAASWRMDETYIKVRGKWTYLYRAVDHNGQTLDFRLSEQHNTAAARRFFKRMIATNGTPSRQRVR